LKGAVWCVGVLVAVVLGSGLRADPLPVPLVHWTFDGGVATNCGSGGATYDAIVSGNTAYTNGIAGDGFCLLGGSEGYAAAPGARPSCAGRVCRARGRGPSPAWPRPSRGRGSRWRRG